jgi:hypothetical protein
VFREHLFLSQFRLSTSVTRTFVDQGLPKLKLAGKETFGLNWALSGNIASGLGLAERQSASH